MVFYSEFSPAPTVSDGAAPQAFSVTEINTMIADALESTLPGFLWVEGEVSNLSVAASGHRYFSLKDNGSTISCALFRGSANRIQRDMLNQLQNGDKVVIKANLSVYKPRGSYQLIVSDMEPAGFGALAKAFAALKTQLDQAGLTAAERKKTIPSWPQSIAVVTSESGAAIRDVLTTLQRRAPFIPVTVYPTMVQGEQAPEQIINALAQAHSAHHEVILLVRGGGSLEDLQAFNEESVALAIANATIPIITGVGHETDFTIVDFVSDCRAATPTAAAELASPDKVALQAHLSRQQQRLQSIMTGLLQQSRQQLNHVNHRLHGQHPTRQLQQHQQRMDELLGRLSRTMDARLQQYQQRLTHYQRQLMGQSPVRKLTVSRAQLTQLSEQLALAMRHRLQHQQHDLTDKKQQLNRFSTRLSSCQQQVKGLEARLTLLSPLGVLSRGYALAFDANGALLRDAEAVSVGSPISVRLGSGEILATVDEISKS